MTDGLGAITKVEASYAGMTSNGTERGCPRILIQLVRKLLLRSRLKTCMPTRLVHGEGPHPQAHRIGLGGLATGIEVAELGVELPDRSTHAQRRHLGVAAGPVGGEPQGRCRHAPLSRSAVAGDWARLPRGEPSDD